MVFLIFDSIPAMASMCTITAYSNESGNLTASGEYTHDGGCACDFLPLGTEVLINGKKYVVNDRIGEGSTDHIDIWMDSTADALNWGVKRLDVEW